VERIELLARTGNIAIAAGYVQVTVTGEYRIYPARATRAKWLGPTQRVRLLDGRELTLAIAEHRTRTLTWLPAREV